MFYKPAVVGPQHQCAYCVVKRIF